MRRVIYIASISLVLLLVLSCVGVLEDVDSCANTSRIRVRRRILGIPVSEEIHHTEESQWLVDEFGIDGPTNYEDYLLRPPYLPIVSTPGGNWLILRSIKDVYDRHPEARPEIKQYVQHVFSSPSPVIDGRFVRDLHDRYP